MRTEPRPADDLPKYEYHLLTWGGFYNEEFITKHGFQPGNYWFDTPEERKDYVQKLEEASRKWKARELMTIGHQGYFMNIPTVLHRVSEYKKKKKYTRNNLGYGYPLSAAQYHLRWKWTPGFNDYPFGDQDIDDMFYEGKEFKVIQEWITGAFSHHEILQSDLKNFKDEQESL